MDMLEAMRILATPSTFGSREHIEAMGFMSAKDDIFQRLDNEKPEVVIAALRDWLMRLESQDLRTVDRLVWQEQKRRR